MTIDITRYKLLVGGTAYFELSNGIIYNAKVHNVTWLEELSCLQYHVTTEFGNKIRLTENEIKFIVI